MHYRNLPLSRSVSRNWRIQFANFQIEVLGEYSRELASLRPQLDGTTFSFVIVIKISKHPPPVSDSARWIHGSFRHTMTPRKSILRSANRSDRLLSFTSLSFPVRILTSEYVFHCRQKYFVYTNAWSLGIVLYNRCFFWEMYNWPNVLCGMKNCKKQYMKI